MKSPSFCRMACLGLGLGLSALTGCTETESANAGERCVREGDGGREGYHFPAGSTWVPDCENVLQREYWRVFTDDDRVGYIIPRPDGSAAVQPICSSPEHPLHALVNQYLLCHAAETAEQVDIVNAIDLTDALRLTHYLHTELEFVAVPGVGIQPYPMPDDIILACELGGQPGSADLEALCQRERDRLASGDAFAFSYDVPGAGELATRLNQLYGVP